MQNFRQLKVWQKAHQLNLKLYSSTASFPKSEMFGLCSQIRHAGVSISANLAEGCGRSTDADFARFTYIAMGSACELESHLELAKDLNFLQASDYSIALNDLIEVKKMLASLISRLAESKPSRISAIPAES